MVSLREVNSCRCAGRNLVQRWYHSVYTEFCSKKKKRKEKITEATCVWFSVIVFQSLACWKKRICTKIKDKEVV